MERFGSDTEVTAADVQPSALRAAGFYMLLFFFQLHEEVIGWIGPDVAESTFAHIAETVMSPKLVRMDGAVPRNASDAAAGVVPFVHL